MSRFPLALSRAIAPVALAAALFSTACSDDDAVTQPGSIGVTLGQTSATLARGGTVVVPVTVSRTNFGGAISLSATDLPSGVIATFDPASVASGSTTSALTLTADGSAAAGTTDITITATGTGVNSQTVKLPLTISNSTAAGITLGTGVTALSTAQGASGSIPIVITRNGDFTGAVDLTVEGLPTGVTATFAQPQLASGSRVTTLTFNTASTATASATAVPITIRAAGTGITAQTRPLNLTITPSTTTGFGASLAPSAFVVTAGQNATSTLTVARQNSFAGNLTFTLEGAPTGVTATVNPSPVTAGTAAITLSTTAAVAPGIYQMTLKGTGTGVTDYSTPITLVVN